MYARIFWINKAYPGKLGIMTRPSGEVHLEVELQTVKRADTDILVSLLEKKEIKEIGLWDEHLYAKKHGMRFIHFPIPDRNIPTDTDKAYGLVKEIASALEEGKNVVIHCRKSIGRSPMLAASVMVWLGASPKKAFQHIKKIRRAQVPDQLSQLRWVEELATLVPDSRKKSSQSLFGKMFGKQF